MRLATVQTLHEPALWGFTPTRGPIGLSISARPIRTCRALSPQSSRAQRRPRPSSNCVREGAGREAICHWQFASAAAQSGQGVFRIGLNYRDHGARRVDLPASPLSSASFQARSSDREFPSLRASHKVDYEAELVVVIGRRGKLISASDAPSYSRRLHGRPRRFGPRLADRRRRASNGCSARPSTPLHRPVRGWSRRMKGPDPCSLGHPAAAQWPDHAGPHYAS